MPADLWWCKTCGAPAAMLGSPLEPELRRAVHVSTGTEYAPGFGEGGEGGWHLVWPTDENPVRRAEADKIEADFGGLFKVTVRFRGVYRAGWAKHADRPELAPAYFEEPSADALRRTLQAARAALEAQALR